MELNRIQFTALTLDGKPIQSYDILRRQDWISQNNTWHTRYFMQDGFSCNETPKTENFIEVRPETICEFTDKAILLINQERIEQIEKHGYNSEHDNEHKYGELAKVAAVLAVMHTDAKVIDFGEYETGNDPWDLETKCKDNPIKALTIAGALIAAELKRLLAIKP